jgi:hypothetical protein
MQDSPDTAGNSLWLDIRLGNQHIVFEFKSEEERPIVVGSLFRADVRVDEPDVCPVEFQFERQGDGISVVPAYGTDVMVNAVRLDRACSLGEHALIEFGEYSLVARVLHSRPSSYLPRFSPGVHDTIEAPFPHFASLLGDGDATRLAVPIVAKRAAAAEASSEAPEATMPAPVSDRRPESPRRHEPRTLRDGTRPRGSGFLGTFQFRAARFAYRRPVYLAATSLVLGFTLGFVFGHVSARRALEAVCGPSSQTVPQ